MTPEEAYEARAAERRRRRLAEHRPLPRWVWSRLLIESAPCRMCEKIKLYDPVTFAEVCRHCDADPAHPPRLSDVR